MFCRLRQWTSCGEPSSISVRRTCLPIQSCNCAMSAIVLVGIKGCRHRLCHLWMPSRKPWCLVGREADQPRRPKVVKSRHPLRQPIIVVVTCYYLQLCLTLTLLHQPSPSIRNLRSPTKSNSGTPKCEKNISTNRTPVNGNHFTRLRQRISVTRREMLLRSSERSVIYLVCVV
jgi:hypothetical protein